MPHEKSLVITNLNFFFRLQVKGSHYDSMSDSETDDAWKAVLLSRTKLNEVKQRLRNLEEEDQFTQNSVELVRLCIQVAQVTSLLVRSKFN